MHALNGTRRMIQRELPHILDWSTSMMSNLSSALTLVGAGRCTSQEDYVPERATRRCMPSSQGDGRC